MRMSSNASLTASTPDTEAILAMMRDDVVWANGMDGGHVRVRDYWTGQWAMVDPEVEPIGFSAGPDGAAEVEVRQAVRDRAGRVLSKESYAISIASRTARSRGSTSASVLRWFGGRLRPIDPASARADREAGRIKG